MSSFFIEMKPRFLRSFEIRNPNTRLPGLSYPITATDIGQANKNQLLLQDTSTQAAGRSKS